MSCVGLTRSGGALMQSRTLFGFDKKKENPEKIMRGNDSSLLCFGQD